MLGEPNTEQFEVVTRLNGETVHRLKIHDPFVRTTTTIKGIGAAWKCLVSGLKVETCVNGSHGAMRAVMMLDPVQLASVDLESERTASQFQQPMGFADAGSVSSPNLSPPLLPLPKERKE